MQHFSLERTLRTLNINQDAGYFCLIQEEIIETVIYTLKIHLSFKTNIIWYCHL